MKKIIILFSFFFLIGCGTATKWENGIIQYKYEDYFSEEEKATIQEAMTDWEVKTNGIVTFKEADKDFWHPLLIKRTKDENCSATIGYSGSKKNYLKLLKNFSDYVVKHELGHVIGLIHEHQREDRDKYIKINWKNVKKNLVDQFMIKRTNLYKTNKLNYDYRSIMHYTSFEFSKNNKNTIISLSKFIDTFDLGGDQITELDVKKVEMIYGTSKKEVVEENIPLEQQEDFEINTIDDKEEEINTYDESIVEETLTTE